MQENFQHCEIAKSEKTLHALDVHDIIGTAENKMSNKKYTEQVKKTDRIFVHSIYISEDNKGIS